MQNKGIVTGVIRGPTVYFNAQSLHPVLPISRIARLHSGDGRVIELSTTPLARLLPAIQQQTAARSAAPSAPGRRVFLIRLRASETVELKAR